MDKTEMMDQFLKLRESFKKKDFDTWVDVWPAFEQNFQDFVKMHGSTPLPDSNINFFEGLQPTGPEGYEHLEINPEGPRFNPDDLEIPEELIAEFAGASMPPPPPPVSDSAAAPGYEHLEINPEGPQFNPDDLEIPEELIAAFAGAPLPPPVNKAPPPPPPVSDSAAAAPPPADGISQRLSEAHRLAEEASVMVNTLYLDGSIKLNKDSVAHLEGCQTNITAATEALQSATILLSEARSVNQDESLTELLNDL